MNKGKLYKFKGKQVAKRCSCGKETKRMVKRTYPFGKNSGSIKTTFYKCMACGKKTN